MCYFVKSDTMWLMTPIYKLSLTCVLFFLFFKLVPALSSKMPDGMMVFSLGGASIFELSWVIARGRYGHGKHFYKYDKDRFTIS